MTSVYSKKNKEAMKGKMLCLILLLQLVDYILSNSKLLYVLIQSI